MDTILLDKIPAKIEAENLMKRLHVRPASPDAQELASMVDEAARIARPKALYRLAFIESKADESLLISGVRFDSRVLRVNLDKTDRVFAFVATCGMELQEWGDRFDDMLQNFWAEAIKEEALKCAIEFLQRTVDARYRPGHTSTMSPGSLANWPITQQGPLFQLLGDPASGAGVQLTDSLLMVPTKSVSGVIFATDASFESCLLCPREGCPNRRAPYDETLYEREYCPAVS